MNTDFNFDTAIYGHVDEATALVIDDYPYGFRLRTQIRYWIETTKNGDRFVSQTLNPKTDRWNKPKKSIYAEVMAMYRDPNTGYISHVGLTPYSNDDAIAYFKSIAEQRLSAAQIKKLAILIAAHKVMSKVSWSVEIDRSTPEERAEKDAEQQKLRGLVGRAIARESVTTERQIKTQVARQARPRPLRGDA